MKKAKPYKGKEYEIGKLYEFSIDSEKWVIGELHSISGVIMPFGFDGGTKFANYCREIAGSLGKITKHKITPEVGKLYKVSDKESFDYVLWGGINTLAYGWEIICEMVEKE